MTQTAVQRFEAELTSASVSRRNTELHYRKVSAQLTASINREASRREIDKLADALLEASQHIDTICERERDLREQLEAARERELSQLAQAMA